MKPTILYHRLIMKDGKLTREPVFGIRSALGSILIEDMPESAEMDFQEHLADGSASYSGNKIGRHDLREF